MIVPVRAGLPSGFGCTTYSTLFVPTELPVVTVIGLEFAFLIGGLVVTEQVFNLNGIGKLFVQAVTRSDFTMVQALVLLVATFFISVNFVIDLLYAWLDPRIRYR